LMEIVSEPDLRSADEARDYAVALRTLLRAIGASDADMEKGQLRAEPNISIRRAGSRELCLKTELKNINSFRALHRAIHYEVARQTVLLESGGRVVQETRGWSEPEQRTFSQRTKEFAEDYRYFPEPDLPPLEIDRAWTDRLRAAFPELPGARSGRLVSQHALPAADAALIAADRELADLFEGAVAAGAEPRPAANWIIGEVAPTGKFPTARHLADLVVLVSSGKITRDQGREVLAESVDSGRSPSDLVAEHGYAKLSDPVEVRKVVESVLEANQKAVQDYRAGKAQVLGFLVAQVKMKATHIDRELASETIKEMLK
jgi:aspartyl-tRNA(Asn)/glutamyl-tRNA(Gln) amidotransferase subunit B